MSGSKKTLEMSNTLSDGLRYELTTYITMQVIPGEYFFKFCRIIFSLLVENHGKMTKWTLS